MVEEILRNFDRTVEIVRLVRFVPRGFSYKSHYVISLQACFPTDILHGRGFIRSFKEGDPLNPPFVNACIDVLSIGEKGGRF